MPRTASNSPWSARANRLSPEKGPDATTPWLTRRLNRRSNDALLFVAKAPTLAGVRIQAADGDAWLDQAKAPAKVRVHDAEDRFNSVPRQSIRDLAQGAVNRGQGDPQLSPDQEHDGGSAPAHSSSSSVCPG